MSKLRRYPVSNGEPLRISAHFADREARIWALEQAHSAKHEPITVLLVSPFAEDHAGLREILARAEFRLISSRSAQEADAILHKKQVPVVIAERNLKDCCWKDMCCAIQRLPKRPWPRLIVAAEKAGDVLWSEVLSLGASDVVAKPFDPEEIVWCLKDAWVAWRRELELDGKPRARAAGSGTG